VLPARRLRLALPALAAVALAGCGTAGTVSTTGLSGPEKAIATTISNFQSDAETNAPSKVCENDLAPSVVQALSTGGHTCAGVISEQLKVVDSFDLALVAHSIKVNGDTATAEVEDTQSGKTTHIDTITLVKSGSTWKISKLGG
jgi:hypothetical protein